MTLIMQPFISTRRFVAILAVGFAAITVVILLAVLPRGPSPSAAEKQGQREAHRFIECVHAGRTDCR